MPSAGKLSGISTNFNLHAITARREHIHAAFVAHCGGKYEKINVRRRIRGDAIWIRER